MTKKSRQWFRGSTRPITRECRPPKSNFLLHPLFDAQYDSAVASNFSRLNRHSQTIDKYDTTPSPTKTVRPQEPRLFTHTYNFNSVWGRRYALPLQDSGARVVVRIGLCPPPRTFPLQFVRRIFVLSHCLQFTDAYIHRVPVTFIFHDVFSFC